MGTRRGVGRWLRGAALGIAVAFTLLPFLWIAETSLKDFKTIAQGMVFFRPTLDNYQSLFGQGSDFPRFFENSVLITLLATLAATICGALAAYSLVKFRFPWGLDRYLLGWLLFVRMIHPIALAIPFFLIVKGLHLYDTRVGLALAYTALNLPFGVWMMRSFFHDLPESLDEAARVDGCSHFGAFRHVVVPLVAPGLAATAIFTFILSWNEYLFGLILTETPRAMTFPVGMARLAHEYFVKWGEMSAAATVFVIPVFVFALLVQRHMIRGLTLGAVKS